MNMRIGKKGDIHQNTYRLENIRDNQENETKLRFVKATTFPRSPLGIFIGNRSYCSSKKNAKIERKFDQRVNSRTHIVRRFLIKICLGIKNDSSPTQIHGITKERIDESWINNERPRSDKELE